MTEEEVVTPNSAVVNEAEEIEEVTWKDLVSRLLLFLLRFLLVS